MNLKSISTTIKRISEVNVFGVGYMHLAFEDGDDLYVTEHGLPFIENLLPENFWTDNEWFKGHSKKLSGTSTLYKITTKPVDGRCKDIVLKWNRMGQDVPGLTGVDEGSNIEFNSPFEEFALVRELRYARHELSGRVITHKPLAIYVPGSQIQLDRLGRKLYKMQFLVSRHDEIELDIFRNYAVLYEWIKGIDAVEAFKRHALSEDEMLQLALRSHADVKQKGFYVGDPKPHHVIVRLDKNGRLVRDNAGEVLYALIDFELLKRTQIWEEKIKAVKRKTYLEKQAHRFEEKTPTSFPPHLSRVNIMGVDYVYGRVEGIDAALWVVGKDPGLFDFFLPEQWRKTPRTKLSVVNQVYRTTTKDNIHIVWKVSKAGEQPDMDPFKENEQEIIQFGYNSPFEEIALAVELSTKGIPTTYPRAIYMTSSKHQIHDFLRDDSRYRTHSNILTPDGKPVLSEHHDYIIIWGYWNGPDEFLAVKDESPCQGIDALRAYRERLLDKQMYVRLIQLAKRRLAEVGVEDLNLRGSHILLSLDNSGKFVENRDGVPEIRICNFELLRKIKA